MSEENNVEEIKQEAAAETVTEHAKGIVKGTPITNYVIDYIELEPGGPKALRRVALDHIENPDERKERLKRLKEEKKIRKLGYPPYETTDKKVLRKRAAHRALSVFTKMFRPIWIITLIIGVLLAASGPMLLLINYIIIIFLALATLGLILIGKTEENFIFITEDMAGQLAIVGAVILIFAAIVLVADIILSIIKASIRKKLKTIALETKNGTEKPLTKELTTENN